MKTNMAMLKLVEHPNLFSATRNFRESLFFKIYVKEDRLWRVYRQGPAFDSIMWAVEGWNLIHNEKTYEFIVKLYPGGRYELFLPAGTNIPNPS